MRPTVRLRLTALFGALFLVAGVLLLAVNYVLVRNNLTHDQVSVTVSSPEASPNTPVTGPSIEGEAPQAGGVVGEPLIVDGRPASVADLHARLIDDTLQNLLVRSGQALAFVAVASVALGWIVAGRVLQPLQRITDRARQISEHNLHERIQLDGPHDELKELADTFDDLLARLEHAFDSQRRFIANASHELRTPLAIIRAELDVALADPEATAAELRRAGEAARGATIRSEALVSRLLVLARSDRGLDATEPVALDGVLAEVLPQVAPEAERRGIGLRFDVAPVDVPGDRALLERLAANLLENAVRYNVEGGLAEVAAFAAGREAVLRVANTGEPLDPAAVAGLFEPFRRLAGDRTGYRSGTGLGLSIVRSVAAAHGGTATARARDGGGLEVEVRLPRAGGPATSAGRPGDGGRESPGGREVGGRPTPAGAAPVPRHRGGPPAGSAGPCSTASPSLLQPSEEHEKTS